MLVCFIVSSMNPALCNGKIVDRIVAIVNTEIIMLSELEKRTDIYYQQIDASNYPEEARQKMKFEARDQALNSMISAELAKQECARLGVKVSDQEIDARIERLKQANSLTDEGLREYLKKDGLTLEDLKKQVRDSVLMSKLTNTEVSSKIVITDQEVKEYYEQHSEEYAGVQKHHLHYILMPYTFKDAGSDLTPRETMEKIVEMFKAGESFLYLIEKASEPSMGGSGGDLGYFRLEELTQELSETISAMKPGDITPIMEIEQGYQVIWLKETVSENGMSIEEATPRIQEILYAEQAKKRYEQWVSELKKKAYVKIIR